ncbi:MAG: TatD family hydrolase [Desulfurispora sp.]|uniref:TatD family hydrolase n=1 Tax=Desulfurispora sp. TaxID=3014275 RepID=UPI00404A8125
MLMSTDSRPMLIDTHAHLDDRKFAADLPAVLQRARQAGVVRIINAAYDLPSCRRAVALAEEHTMIYALVGIHPHDAGRLPADYLQQLAELAGHKKVLAIGEIGLDYYRDLSPRPVQQQVFRQQLDLARQLDLPVVIHDRDAHGDILSILKNDGVPRRGGVMHCFSGSWEMAQECIKLGFYISLAGPVTYPNSRRLQEIAARLPLERLFIETDCPYLAPQAHRGQRNEPAYVALVAQEIARLRGIEVDALGRAVVANAAALFGEI